MTTFKEQAEAVVSGDRRRDYGSPLLNHLRIAVRWSLLLQQKLTFNCSVTPVDVALMMVDLKLARNQQTWKEDNFVDMIGYLYCLDSMHSEMQTLGYADGAAALAGMSLSELVLLLKRIEDENATANSD
jgi:hypothetical protein